MRIAQKNKLHLRHFSVPSYEQMSCVITPGISLPGMPRRVKRFCQPQFVHICCVCVNTELKHLSIINFICIGTLMFALINQYTLFVQYHSGEPQRFEPSSVFARADNGFTSEPTKLYCNIYLGQKILVCRMDNQNILSTIKIGKQKIFGLQNGQPEYILSTIKICK